MTNFSNFINLTPHSVNLFESDGITQVVSIPASGFILRVEQDEVDSAPYVVNVEYGDVYLEDRDKNRVELGEVIPCLDSPVVISSFCIDPMVELGYSSVYVPNTGPTERGAVRFNEEDAPNPGLVGKIKGVKSLRKV